ncbi:hypothetical protein ACFE04_002909 [Oxalis oulophora]
MKLLPLLSYSNTTNFTLFTNNATLKRKRNCLRIFIVNAEAQTQEIRVCTNRTCRKQGSFQTLETLSGLAPPTVTVKPCGCLGRCGAGPNLALLPDGVIVGHCGTAAHAARVMLGFCYSSNVDDNNGDALRKSLEALALRKRAQSKVDEANFSESELLLSQAIDLDALGGIHILYKERSRVRLAMGNYSGALADAREASSIAPEDPEAYMCEGDAFMSMDQYDAAEKSYSTCLEIDPSLRRSKSFKLRIAKLNEKLAAANT